MRYVIAGGTLMIGAAIFAYSYFTKPERVFGTRELDCPAHEIEWTSTADGTTITGCGKTLRAICDEERCRMPD